MVLVGIKNSTKENQRFVMKLSGAEIIIKLIERQGITQLAGIPGGANLPMYDALSRSTKIRHILARHEQGAGFIAQGQARTTGKASVFFATSGPGATNALTAIADAKLDSVPVICITGQVPQALIGTDAFQEIDTFGLSVPITKHSYFVRSAKELLDVIPEAFSIAVSGRPGPILIDVPKDVQSEIIEIDAFPEIGEQGAIKRIEPEEASAAAEMIRASERPIIYLGGGAIHAEASAEVIELVDCIDAPLTSTLMGLGAFPSDDRHFIGMLGMHAARYTNKIMEESDLLIVLGARFDDRATGKVAEFCPNANVLHIDIDLSEISKLKKAHLGIVGDLKDAIRQILSQIEGRSLGDWNARVQEIKAAYPMEMEDLHDPMSEYGIIHQTSQIVGEDAIITTDVGQHQMRVAQCYQFNKPRKWQTSGGLGTMGFGLPTAIGAALEERDKTIVCFSGDGSILMNIQELVTAVEENANVKIIVSNNNSLGLVHQQQNLFYGKNIFAANFSKSIDFTMLARACGMNAYDLGQVENPGKTLKHALTEKGPALINVPIDVERRVYPMVPPGGANSEMLHEDRELV